MIARLVLSRQTLRSAFPTTTAITYHQPVSPLRHFSNSVANMGKQEWMVILPDKPGALKTRMEIRPKHLEGVKPNVDSGLLVLGGASLDEPFKEGEPPKINGSVLMAEADTEEEVWELVKGDVYYSGGVWDLDKIQIFPFRSAVRQPLK